MKKIKDTDVELLSRLSADYDDWYSSEENKAVLVKGSNEDLERFITLIDDLKNLDEDYVVNLLEDINIDVQIISTELYELESMTDIPVDVVARNAKLRLSPSDIYGYDFEHKKDKLLNKVCDLNKRTTEILNYFKERKENDCA